MTDSLKIRIGEGLSNLFFGSLMFEAEQLFGKADKEELLNDFAENSTIVWHYNEYDFSLFFDSINAKPFVYVEIGNPKTELWDERIFNFPEKKIIELFKSKGIYLHETEHQEWDEKRLSFDEVNIDFYFSKNKLVSINYGIITEGLQTLILPN